MSAPVTDSRFTAFLEFGALHLVRSRDIPKLLPFGHCRRSAREDLLGDRRSKTIVVHKLLGRVVWLIKFCATSLQRFRPGTCLHTFRWLLQSHSLRQ